MYQLEYWKSCDICCIKNHSSLGRGIIRRNSNDAILNSTTWLLFWKLSSVLEEHANDFFSEENLIHSSSIWETFLNFPWYQSSFFWHEIIYKESFPFEFFNQFFIIWQSNESLQLEEWALRVLGWFHEGINSKNSIVLCDCQHWMRFSLRSRVLNNSEWLAWFH